MAFIVSRKNGSWEAREAFRGNAGPRTRTLASFRELGPEVIEQIIDRASQPVDLEDLRRRALRAGVPMLTEVDRMAARVTRTIALGRSPSKNYAILLADSLLEKPELPHHLGRMKIWAGATLDERADAVADLLQATGAFPPVDWKSRDRRPRFPRIDSNK